VEFAYDGGGFGKGGNVTLYTDGNKTAEGRLEHTEPIGFGGEFTDIGRDDLSLVTSDYANGNSAPREPSTGSSSSPVTTATTTWSTPSRCSTS
jgi:hypothetical protein